MVRGNEDYPEEIDDQLKNFDSSVSSVKTMLEKLMSNSRNEQPHKVSFFSPLKIHLYELALLTFSLTHK